MSRATSWHGGSALQPPRRLWEVVVDRGLDVALLLPPLFCAGCVLSRSSGFVLPPAIATAALLPPAIVPAAAAVVAALLLRRSRAALVGLACVLAAGAALAPRLPLANATADSGPGTPITLVTANLHFRNHDLGAAVEAVNSQEADFVFLQEVSPQAADLLAARAADAGYRWTVLRPQWGSTGLAVLSRHEVIQHAVLMLDGRPLLRTDVMVGTAVVRLFDVHLEAPVTRQAAQRWKSELESLRQLLRPAESGLLIAAGDFNATLDHASFRSLLRTDLQDVASRRSSPWLATWPVGKAPLPPLLQPDHVVTSSAIGVAGLRAIPCPGSDHKMLLASMSVPAFQQRVSG